MASHQIINLALLSSSCGVPIRSYTFRYTINGAKLSCIDAGEKLNTMEMLPGGHSLVTGGESGHVIIRGLRNLGKLA